MKRIFINGRFMKRNITGVERYAREIILGLDKIVPKGTFFLVLPPKVESTLMLNNIEVIRIGLFRNRFWEHLSFPLFVKKNRGLSLNLCNVGPIPNPGITCIFDTKIKDYPYFFSRSFVIWYTILFYNTIKKSVFLITDSNSAKDDILRHYTINPDRIVVAPCGWQHMQDINYDENALKRYRLIKDKYYFAMGSLDPNKNFKWIAEMARIKPNYTFAVAGSINNRIFSDNIGVECPENMVFLGYVSDSEAKTLMRDCKAFLFPSFCEGFGMPPLEALSAGTRTIIVSDIRVMHEVFGDGATYIDPNIPQKIRNEVVISDSARADILKKYDWNLSARIILSNLMKRV